MLCWLNNANQQNCNDIYLTGLGWDCLEMHAFTMICFETDHSKRLSLHHWSQTSDVHLPFARLGLCYKKTFKYFLKFCVFTCLYHKQKRYQNEPFIDYSIIQGHLTDWIVMIPMCLSAARDRNTFESFQANFNYNQLRLIMSSL